jgi:hypothetical protein
LGIRKGFKVLKEGTKFFIKISKKKTIKRTIKKIMKVIPVLKRKKANSYYLEID